MTSPFGEAEEERLRWYFEDYLTFPFTQQVRAAEAARSVVTYGEALFEQLFKGDPDVYAQYQAAAAQGLQTYRWISLASPRFTSCTGKPCASPAVTPWCCMGP